MISSINGQSTHYNTKINSITFNLNFKNHSLSKLNHKKYQLKVIHNNFSLSSKKIIISAQCTIN